MNMHTRSIARWGVTAAALVMGAGAALAQTAWVLPSAYPPANYHTENLMQFASDVDDATRTIEAFLEKPD